MALAALNSNRSPASTAEASVESDSQSISTSQKATINVFHALILETEKRSKNWINCIESVSENTLDPLKDFTKERTSFIARATESFKESQDEIVSSLVQLDVARRDYDEAAKSADLAEKKHSVAIAGKTSVLTSVKHAFSSTSDEERLVKLSNKNQSAKLRREDARNTLLLAIEASNSVQKCYWNKELPLLFKKLDGEFHPIFASCIQSTVDSDIHINDVMRTGLNSILEEVKKINRDEECKVFQSENSKFFTGPAIVSFEPAGSDNVNKFVATGEKSLVLGKLLAELMKERQSISKNREKAIKEIQGLEQMAKVYQKTPEFGNATNPLEVRFLFC
jgi:hypothetical protein